MASANPTGTVATAAVGSARSANTSNVAMKLNVDYSCPHCGATAVVRDGFVAVPHPSWCPRSRTCGPSARSHDRRGRCAICGGRVPVAASHRHEVGDDVR